MSHLLETYRKNAEAARLEAERSLLPNVRARAVDAAARWAELADQLEKSEAESRVRIDTAAQARKGAR